MIQFSEQLIEATRGVTLNDLEDDWMRMLAIMRLFETLGEAATRVSNQTKKANPEIPWRDATDMRNRLIHGYDDIEYESVLKTVEEEIPALLIQLRALQSAQKRS